MDEDQRQELGAFLRKRREQLVGADLGAAPRRVRRRTPGLRREDVAELCGMSVTWYTWIEQGRATSISAAAIARLADALRLTAAERDYMFVLARKQHSHGSVASPRPELPGVLRQALDATAVPAYALDRAWNACGWNAAAAALLSGWIGGVEHNLLRYVFLDPSARLDIADWTTRARRLVGEFRADTIGHTEDPDVAALVAELTQKSNEFQRFWQEHDVRGRDGGLRVFRHRTLGLVGFDQLTLVPTVAHDFKIVLLLPRPLEEAQDSNAKPR